MDFNLEMFQYRFINFNKCTIVRQDVNDRENHCAGVHVCMCVCAWACVCDREITWEEGLRGSSVQSAYFFCNKYIYFGQFTNEMAYTGLICIYLYIFVSSH